MTVANNKMIKLTYELRLESADTDIYEAATEENPLVFLYGANMMIPAFEAQLKDMNVGDNFEIALKAEDAYGEINDDAIVDLPKNIFEVDGKVDEEMLKVGNSVPMMSSNGQRMNGVILDITEETIQMDFNHALAGEDLFFKGTILDVREPSEDELKAAFGGNEGGCGGSCGCSGDDCGDGEGHEHKEGGCGGGCC